LPILTALSGLDKKDPPNLLLEIILFVCLFFLLIDDDYLRMQVDFSVDSFSLFFFAM